MMVRRGRSLAWLGGALVAATVAVIVALTHAGSEPATMAERVHAVASGLRCPECQNLSVADSPSGLAREMRAEIARRLRAGQSPREVRDYFVSRYGDWILLAPRARGLAVVAWAVPAAAVGAGLLVLAMLLVRRRRRDPGPVPIRSRPADARVERELVLLEEPE